jgi:predicted nuclease of predicted toxin-antitoxin system
MKLWVDAQMSPRMALWINANFAVVAVPLRDLGLRDAEDEAIFAAARIAGVIVLTKDSDFVHLLERQGGPPQILWLTCGNTSEAALRQIFTKHLPAALELFAAGEDLVEIGSV